MLTYMGTYLKKLLSFYMPILFELDKIDSVLTVLNLNV